jgi:hypothetical protein
VPEKHIREEPESRGRHCECQRSSQTACRACSDAMSQRALEEVAQARVDAEQETMALVLTVSSLGRIVGMRTEKEPERCVYDVAEVLVCAT